jgi:hypothetical protein
LKIEMPKLDIAATSDAAEPQRSARDFTAREREVAKPALALTGVAALTARGAKDKKEAAAAAAAAVPPPPPPPPVQMPAPAPVSASETSPRGSLSRMLGFGSKPSAAAAAPSFAAESAAAGPVVKLTLPVADLKLSELKGRDPDAPLATPRKDAPETSRRKKAGMPDEPQSTVASSDEATKQENQPWAQPQGQEHQRV